MKMAKAWKKIVAAKKKAGHQEDWSVAEVCLAGSASEYNFVTRHSFTGEAQLAHYLERHEIGRTGLSGNRFGGCRCV